MLPYGTIRCHYDYQVLRISCMYYLKQAPAPTNPPPPLPRFLTFPSEAPGTRPATSSIFTGIYRTPFMHLPRTKEKGGGGKMRVRGGGGGEGGGGRKESILIFYYRYINSAMRPRVYLMFSLLIPWAAPLNEGVQYLNDAYEISSR